MAKASRGEPRFTGIGSNVARTWTKRAFSPPVNFMPRAVLFVKTRDAPGEKMRPPEKSSTTTGFHDATRRCHSTSDPLSTLPSFAAFDAAAARATDVDGDASLRDEEQRDAVQGLISQLAQRVLARDATKSDFHHS